MALLPWVAVRVPGGGSSIGVDPRERHAWRPAMPTPDPDGRWDRLAGEALAGVRRWREAHPTASLTEIEAAVDAEFAGLRARVVADAAVASAAAVPTAAARPTCPDRGGSVPHAAADAAAVLGLLPGALTPRLHEGLVRLGAEIPFGRAAALFARFTGVPVSEATARRLTEAAGAAAVVVAAAEVARLERAAPPPPPGPAVQQVSVDGAMAPLVGGEWAEVKTLVVGVVADRAGEPGLTAPSY